MQKYAKICSDPISVSPMHSYAAVHLLFIYTKYANICKICKHEIYMQNMHSPEGTGNCSSCYGQVENEF